MGERERERRERRQGGKLMITSLYMGVNKSIFLEGGKVVICGILLNVWWIFAFKFLKNN